MSWEGNLSRLCLRPSCFQPSICNNNINSMTRKSLQVSLQEMHDYVQAWWRSCPPRGSQWAPWRESSSCPQIPALTPCPSQFGPGGGGTWGEERVGLPPWEKGLYLHTKHQLVVMCGQVQEALFGNVPGISFWCQIDLASVFAHLLDTSHPNQTGSLAEIESLAMSISNSTGWLLYTTRRPPTFIGILSCWSSFKLDTCAMCNPPYFPDSRHCKSCWRDSLV